MRKSMAALFIGRLRKFYRETANLNGVLRGKENIEAYFGLMRTYEHGIELNHFKPRDNEKRKADRLMDGIREMFESHGVYYAGGRR